MKTITPALLLLVTFLTSSSAQTPPTNMVLIPTGTFTMGNCMDTNEGWSEELPLHEVQVSAFFMDRFEVTEALWDEVRQWAITNGYDFDTVGGVSPWWGNLRKGPNYPITCVNWYDVVKWCNARSEKEGRVPAYYASMAMTVVYRTGKVNVNNDWVKWNSGYRLPTEAEWEKGARGGSDVHRFAWSDTNTITHSKANYFAKPGFYTYDANPAGGGWHPTFAVGSSPYSSPVGYFAPNGYDLHDMTGNVWEVCWDWFSTTYYSSSPQNDPRGPASGLDRVGRGGGWNTEAAFCRLAVRNHFHPLFGSYTIGFRSVLPSGQ